MLHRISEFCDKIESIKTDADKLRALKYDTPKSKGRDLEIQALIDQIQADCFLISRDKSSYTKLEGGKDDE